MKKNHIIFMLVFFAFMQQGHTMMGRRAVTDNSMMAPRYNPESIENAQTITREQQLKKIMDLRRLWEERDMAKNLCQTKKNALSSSKKKSQKQKKIDVMEKEIKEMDINIENIERDLFDVYCKRMKKLPREHLQQIESQVHSLMEERKNLLQEKEKGRDVEIIEKKVREIDENIICIRLGQTEEDKKKLEEQETEELMSGLSMLNKLSEENLKRFLNPLKNKGCEEQLNYNDFVEGFCKAFTQSFPQTKDSIEKKKDVFDDIAMKLQADHNELVGMVRDMEKLLASGGFNMEQKTPESAPKTKVTKKQAQEKGMETLSALEQKRYGTMEALSKEQTDETGKSTKASSPWKEEEKKA